MTDPGKRLDTWLPSKEWKAATVAAAESGVTLGRFTHDAIIAAARAWEAAKERVWNCCLEDCSRGSFAERKRLSAFGRPERWESQKRAMIERWAAAGFYRPGERERALRALPCLPIDGISPRHTQNGKLT